MVVRDRARGTVSSTLIALGKKPRDAIYQFAGGPPDTYSGYVRPNNQGIVAFDNENSMEEGVCFLGPTGQ